MPGPITEKQADQIEDLLQAVMDTAEEAWQEVAKPGVMMKQPIRDRVQKMMNLIGELQVLLATESNER